MPERLNIRPGDLVEVVNAESRKGDPKPTFLVGQRLRVHSVTSDGRALCVAGHAGFWRAFRFKPL